MKILILCTGNSCRSQMAQGILQALDARLEVASAGIRPAYQVHPMAVSVMRDIGIDISPNRPRSVADYVNESWNYVITVCDGANERCPVFLGNVDNRLHFGFDDPAQAIGTMEERRSAFVRVRDELKDVFIEFYNKEIKPHLE